MIKKQFYEKHFCKNKKVLTKKIKKILELKKRRQFRRGSR